MNCSVPTIEFFRFEELIMGTFTHFDLKLIKPDFDSHLLDSVIELDGLRNKILFGTTKPFMFFQLKDIFHLLESLGSARIEGNNTTIAEIVESKIDDSHNEKSSLKEIQNLRNAIDYIDDSIDDSPISNVFIRELHKTAVENLPTPPQGEGDLTPGKYRTYKVEIQKSEHQPPELETQVKAYIDELVQFINTDHPPKYDLIKTALVHHRFMWIHPFGNGNGRTGRLLTYAMLVKQGFNIKKGRLINPTAIFCLDRNLYNSMLSEADKGTIEGLTTWCEFVLSGFKTEIEKIDKLLDYSFFKEEIVIPSLKISLERGLITAVEENILRTTVNSDSQTIMNGDIKKHILKDKSPQQISNVIKGLIDKKMLAPLKKSPRKYFLRFDNNYLLRGVIQMLEAKDFLPVKD